MTRPDSAKYFKELNMKERIFSVLTNYQRFVYGWGDIFSYFIKCVPCRKRHSSFFKMPSNIKHRLYARGNRKLNKELDVINLL